MGAPRDGGADLLEMGLDGGSIGVRQDKRSAGAVAWADGAEQIGAALTLILGLAPPRALAHPLPHQAVLLTERDYEPVNPPNPSRKHLHSYNRHAYKARNLIERMFCRLKDFRRIVTRYDKRTDTFLAAFFIAETLI